MRRILLVMSNVIRGTLHNRVLYLWIIGIVVVLIRIAPAFFIDSPDPRAALGRARALLGGMEVWSFLCIAVAVFMGAVTVQNEIQSKTVVALLSRPVRRWEVLVGNWLAIQVFSTATLVLGVLLTIAGMRHVGVAFDASVLTLAALHTSAATMLYSATAIAMGAVPSTGIASASLIVPFFPMLAEFLSQDSRPSYHVAGVALDYLNPPGYSSLYQFTVSTVFQLDGIAHARLLTENLMYGLVFFVIGCFVFSRRDLKLG